MKKVPGVGPKLVDVLRRLGVKTCGDVLKKPREHWEERLGSYGAVLHDRARGVDPGGVVVSSGAKSCSAENTFREDTTDRDVLVKWLLSQSERVGADLRRHGYRGRTVTLKVKFADFKQITRSKSLDARTDKTDAIFETACGLLSELELRRAVRLIGVGVSNFEARPRQLDLLGETPREMEASSELDRAVDAVREKFGSEAVTRGELLGFRRRKG